jgi:hypothetical protein
MLSIRKSVLKDQDTDIINAYINKNYLDTSKHNVVSYKKGPSYFTGLKSPQVKSSDTSKSNSLSTQLLKT